MTKNKTKDPVVTFLNFKHAEFASQETECFEATVMVDGKKFCHASDEGCGGEMRLDPLKQGITNAQLMDEIHKVGCRINPKSLRHYSAKKKEEYKWIDDDAERHAAHDKEMRESDNVTSYEIFQDLVSNALTRELYRKDLKKATVKKVLWLDAADGKVYQSGTAKNAAHRNALAVRIAEKYKGCIILNNMNKEEALDLFIAKCAS